MAKHYLNDVVNDGESTQKIDHYVIFASLKSKLINRIPGWRLLISSLPGSALIERTLQRECSPYLAEMHFLLRKNLKKSCMVMSKCM